jgi:peptide/nickel transport system permease protein
MLVGATGGGSWVWIIVIIGLTQWTGIARLVRAETLRIKKQEYTESGRALGYSQWRLLLWHALPNALPPAIIAIAFGIANAILLESFLAFIGLGISPDHPTWGTLLNTGRQDPTAWWMALFPGLAIFLTVLSFNVLGDQLNDLLVGKGRKYKK